jgi:hypothetical protein
MKKITLILIVLASKLVAQQDPQYNLYQFNPLIINPAYAGARDGIVGTASIRNQWVQSLQVYMRQCSIEI